MLSSVLVKTDNININQETSTKFLGVSINQTLT